MRRVVVIVVFLLAGAVVNVAVAWGCAFAPPLSWDNEAMRGWFRWKADGQIWSVFLFRRAGSAELFSDCAVWSRSLTAQQLAHLEAGGEINDMKLLDDNDLPHWSRYRQRTSEVELQQLREVWHERVFGWPLVSFKYVSENDIRPDIRRGLDEYKEPRTVGAMGRATFLGLPPRLLPTDPLWPGFAVNTILYAVVLWLLIPGPFALRSLIRRRRGLCSACAYPMGEAAVCTECGRGLPGRAEAAT